MAISTRERVTRYPGRPPETALSFAQFPSQQGKPITLLARTGKAIRAPPVRRPARHRQSAHRKPIQKIGFSQRRISHELIADVFQGSFELRKSVLAARLVSGSAICPLTRVPACCSVKPRPVNRWTKRRVSNAMASDLMPRYEARQSCQDYASARRKHAGKPLLMCRLFCGFRRVFP